MSAQFVAVGVAVAIAAAVYAKVTLTIRVPQARQIEALIRDGCQTASWRQPRHGPRPGAHIMQPESFFKSPPAPL